MRGLVMIAERQMTAETWFDNRCTRFFHGGNGHGFLLNWVKMETRGGKSQTAASLNGNRGRRSKFRRNDAVRTFFNGSRVDIQIARSDGTQFHRGCLGDISAPDRKHLVDAPARADVVFHVGGGRRRIHPSRRPQPVSTNCPSSQGGDRHAIVHQHVKRCRCRQVDLDGHAADFVVVEGHDIVPANELRREPFSLEPVPLVGTIDEGLAIFLKTALDDAVVFGGFRILEVVSNFSNQTGATAPAAVQPAGDQ